MKNYEVIREIFNGCSGKFMIDNTFPDEVQTDDIEETLKGWFGGDLPPYEKDTLEDGTEVYSFESPHRYRYSFTEF